MSSGLIASDLVPIGGGYVVLMASLAIGLRLDRRAGGEQKADGNDERLPVIGRLARRSPAGWPRFAVQVGVTAVGGYVLLMAVLVAFYYGVSRVANHFLESGFTGCAMLLALALPVFAIASWVAHRKRRRSEPDGPDARAAGQAGPQ